MQMGTFPDGHTHNQNPNAHPYFLGLYRNHYHTIYADPPWPEVGGGKIKRGADRHYDVMSVKDIINLPVGDLVHPFGCHLYLWVTNNYLEAGLQCMKAWGFRYVTKITWVKPTMGLGQYFRGMTEDCLFGISLKNQLPYRTVGEKRLQGVTVIHAPKQEHSRKPEQMREMIMRVSYEPRAELFGRCRIEGWNVWGNQSDAVGVTQSSLGLDGMADED